MMLESYGFIINMYYKNRTARLYSIKVRDCTRLDPWAPADFFVMGGTNVKNAHNKKKRGYAYGEKTLHMVKKSPHKDEKKTHVKKNTSH